MEKNKESVGRQRDLTERREEKMAKRQKGQKEEDEKERKGDWRGA